MIIIIMIIIMIIIVDLYPQHFYDDLFISMLL